MMQPTLGFNADDVLLQDIVKKEDLDEIVQWLKKENLPNYSDEQIIQFLLSCDNVHDATKKTIKAYVEITNGCDEIFSNRNVERIDVQKYLNVGEICILPERTHDGCILLLNRLVDSNYKNFEMAPHLTVLTMTIDSAIYDYPANGLIIIIDITGMSWKHMFCLRLGLLRTFAHYLQEGLPVKLHKIYFLNTTPLLDKFMSAVRPFMKKEVMDKMVTFKVGDTGLFCEKCVPERFLPIDYGGKMPCVQTLHQNQIEKFKDLISYFEAEEKQRKCINP